MKTILILIIIICFFRLYLGSYPMNSNIRKKLERRFSVIAYSALVFLAAFKGETVGADTGGYIADYLMIDGMSIKDVLERYSGYEFFFLIMKFLTIAKAPIWLFFGIIEVVYISSIARFINKYSTDKLYSIVFFIILLFNFSLAGLKQVMAMGLIIHSFLDFTERKWIRTAFFIIMAYFTHPVVLVLLFAYLLFFFKDRKGYGAVLAVSILLLLFSSVTIMSSIVSMMGNEHFELYLESDKTYSSVMLWFYLLLLFSVVPFYNNYSRITDKGIVRFELGCLMIACAVQYLASFSPNLFRLAYLFTPFYMVMLPNAFSAKNTTEGRTMKVIVLVVSILFYAYTSRNFRYTFSW